MRSVLITGGAGFFGQAFVKRLLTDELAERICIFSRNEWNQAQMQAIFNDDDRLRFFLGDVRDAERLRRAMEGCDTVIHGAAIKRVQSVDYNILEACSINITGTQNVVTASIDAQVKTVVLLSSDKACQGRTTYGLSKAMAERIFQQAFPYANRELRPDSKYPNLWSTSFRICRYGNIAASTGSVIPIWRRLLADGVTELPMTNPEMTRFWMTASEAVQMVLETIELESCPGIVIPDLPAYRLGDLAIAMGATGTRPMALAENEKIHERMIEGGPDSSQVRRMSIDELREALTHV